MLDLIFCTKLLINGVNLSDITLTMSDESLSLVLLAATKVLNENGLPAVNTSQQKLHGIQHLEQIELQCIQSMDYICEVYIATIDSILDYSPSHVLNKCKLRPHVSGRCTIVNTVLPCCAVSVAGWVFFFRAPGFLPFFFSAGSSVPRFRNVLKENGLSSSLCSPPFSISYLRGYLHQYISIQLDNESGAPYFLKFCSGSGGREVMRSWYIMLRRGLATNIPVASSRAAIARGRLLKLAITS